MTSATQKCSAIGCKSTSNESIACKLCSLTFHTKCVNVRKTATSFMKENPGFVWFCPHCATNSVSDTAKSLINCTKAVTDMVSKFVSLLSDAMARISSPPTSQLEIAVEHQSTTNVPVQPPPSSVTPSPTHEPTRAPLVGSKKRPHNQVTGDDSTPNQPSKINKTIKPAKASVNFGTNDTAVVLKAVPRSNPIRRSNSPVNIESAPVAPYNDRRGYACLSTGHQRSLGSIRHYLQRASSGVKERGRIKLRIL